MTLFTAEGILRAQTRGMSKGICDEKSVVRMSYLRWLYTQDYGKMKGLDWIYDGYLLSVPELFASRAPGRTCLSALLSEEMGTMEKPLNDSKGCGGVMRMAPAGLFYPKGQAFHRGMEFAALTHSHHTGYIASGAFAYIIAAIIEGASIEEAVAEVSEELKKYKNHEETLEALNKAVEASKGDLPAEEAIPLLGEGWIAEEALSIAVYCALKYKDNFKEGVIASVNHSGDSDSTGAITGNILGAALGKEAIPREWIEGVELREVIEKIAEDLLKGYEEGKEWWRRYPGY